MVLSQGIFVSSKNDRSEIEERERENDKMDDLEILGSARKIAKSMGDHETAKNLDSLQKQLEKHCVLYEVSGYDAMDERQNILVPAQNEKKAVEAFCHFYGVSSTQDITCWIFIPTQDYLIVNPEDYKDLPMSSLEDLDREPYKAPVNDSDDDAHNRMIDTLVEEEIEFRQSVSQEMDF